jgi:ATP phosphoribosyltransferase
MTTIVLPKGRISEDSLEMFRNVFNMDIDFNDRELITKNDDFTFLLVRNQDIPNYVKYGAADLGIVGLDVLEESEERLIKLLNLQIGTCRVSIGMPKDKVLSQIYEKPVVKVASKMVNIAQKYFASKSISVNIIKLYGSIELAPLVGLCDIIVDIVESGDTMKQNGLVEEEVIFTSSAYLVANQNSYCIKKPEILNIQKKLQEYIEKK